MSWAVTEVMLKPDVTCGSVLLAEALHEQQVVVAKAGVMPDEAWVWLALKRALNAGRNVCRGRRIGRWCRGVGEGVLRVADACDFVHLVVRAAVHVSVVVAGRDEM